MKLIDLLVQELPKRGGWPEGVTHIGQDYDRELMFYGRGRAMTGIFLDELAIDHRKCGVSGAGSSSKITQEQYESALAESQKPAWNGEDLPPVGCECEYLDNNGKWYPVIIKYASDQLVVISGVTKILGVEQGTEIAKDIIIDKPQFRTLRSEADKKRDAAVEAIDYWLPGCIPDTPNEFYHAKKIYDAIAAGKIPGVKLED